MAYQILTSQKFTCEGGHSEWVDWWISGGTVVSVGFQNLGNSHEFYASQMFVQSATNVYVQVKNHSTLSTDWYIWIVVSTPSEQVKATSDSGKTKTGQSKVLQTRNK